MGFGPIASDVHVHHGAIKTAKTNLNNMAFIFGKEFNNADDMKILETELAKLNNTTNRLLKKKPEGYKELIKEQNLAKNILLNKYKNTPIAGLNEATEVFFDSNDKPILRRIKMDPAKTIGQGSAVGEIDFLTATPGQREKILTAAGENFTTQLKAYVSTLDKNSKEFKQICTLTAATGGTAASCIERIDQDPEGIAKKITEVEKPVGRLAAFKNAALGFLKSPGFKSFSAAGAVGAVGTALVKEFRNDDPLTYLSNEDQQKNMLVDMATKPISTEFERPSILDYQLPAMGATLAGATALSAPSTIKASQTNLKFATRAPGVERKKPGVVRTAGRVLGRGLGVAASPALLAPFAAADIAGQVAEGDSLTDIATNPFNYLYPAFADQTTLLVVRRNMHVTIKYASKRIKSLRVQCNRKRNRSAAILQVNEIVKG